jgi:hypothetical protein
MPREAVTVKVLMASIGSLGLAGVLNAGVDAKNAKEDSQKREEGFLLFSLRPLRSLLAAFASTLAFNTLAKAQLRNRPPS